MSQKKVDAYKEKKANRAAIMKKEKTILRIQKLAALVICIAAVCWVGFSVRDKVEESAATIEKEVVLDTTALDEYVANLSVKE